MDTFHSEIFKIADFLFFCGERLLETESFILELTRRKKKTSDEDWRKKIKEFLDEYKEYNCQVDVLDKRTNVTCSLINVNPLKLRTLYMEIIAHLDLSTQFSIIQTDEPLIYLIEVKDELEKIELRN